MKRNAPQQQSPSHTTRSNQPFFGDRSKQTFFMPGQTAQQEPFFKPSGAVPVIQAKLTVGAVGDQYEQEADRVASEVVDHINAPLTQPSGEPQSVQRMGEEDEELQMKAAPDAIQRMGEDDEELQMKPITETIQRMDEEENELQMKPVVQRVGTDGGSVSADLEGEIKRARGGGQSLAPQLQAQMGQAMGADFSGVRVHTDGRSDQLNQSIQAKAFTTGRDVFFRQGEYRPESRGGQELIAHELTHVVQQNGRVTNDSIQRFYLESNDDPNGYTWVDNSQWDSNKYEVSPNSTWSNGWRLYNLYRLKNLPSQPKVNPELDEEPPTELTTSPLKEPDQMPQPQVTAEDFLKQYEIGALKGSSKATRIPGANKKNVVEMPAPPEKKQPGYIVTVAGGPSQSTVSIGKRYFDEAWKKSKVSDFKYRMGVVIAVNKWQSIKEGASEATVKETLKKAEVPEVNFDAFGFTWQPTWYRKDEKKVIPLDEVKAEYEKLSPEEQEKALKIAEATKTVLNEGNLPYGLFREMATVNPEIQVQVSKLGTYNNPVYIHSSDPDAQSLEVDTGEGVLTKYDEILSQEPGNKNPTLLLGGYSFREFDSKKLDSKQKPSELTAELTTSLTKLANQLDQVVRNAISSAYPLMLYPTEPNMLILAQDESTEENLFANESLFEGDKGQRTLKEQGGLWGHGTSEGVNLRKNLMAAGYNKKSAETFMQYHSEASLPTDTKGEDRHFIVTGAEGRGVWDAIRSQAQSYVKNDRLKHQFISSLEQPFSQYLRDPKPQDSTNTNNLNKYVKDALDPVEAIILNWLNLFDKFDKDSEAQVIKAKEKAQKAREKLSPKVASDLEKIVKAIEDALTAINKHNQLEWDLFVTMEKAEEEREKKRVKA